MTIRVLDCICIHPPTISLFGDCDYVAELLRRFSLPAAYPLAGGVDVGDEGAEAMLRRAVCVGDGGVAGSAGAHSPGSVVSDAFVRSLCGLLEVLLGTGASVEVSSVVLHNFSVAFAVAVCQGVDATDPVGTSENHPSTAGAPGFGAKVSGEGRMMGGVMIPNPAAGGHSVAPAAAAPRRRALDDGAVADVVGWLGVETFFEMRAAAEAVGGLGGGGGWGGRRGSIEDGGGAGADGWGGPRGGVTGQMFAGPVEGASSRTLLAVLDYTTAALVGTGRLVRAVVVRTIRQDRERRGEGRPKGLKERGGVMEREVELAVRTAFGVPPLAHFREVVKEDEEGAGEGAFDGEGASE